MALIRRACPSDAMGIAILNGYVWKTTYTGLLPDAFIDERLHRLRERADNVRKTIERDNACFVAEEDGSIVGFCMYGPLNRDAASDMGEIYALYVADGLQGEGLGRALFQAAALALAGMGYDRMRINCLKGNPALNFYRKMGGAAIGERVDEVNGVTMTETVLEFRDLPALSADVDIRRI